MKWIRVNWCPYCDESMEMNEGGGYYCKKCEKIHTDTEKEPKPTDSAGFNLKSLYK